MTGPRGYWRERGDIRNLDWAEARGAGKGEQGEGKGNMEWSSGPSWVDSIFLGAYSPGSPLTLF